MTKIVINLLRWLRVKRPFLSSQNAERYLHHHAKRQNDPLRIPKLTSTLTSIINQGYSVVTLMPQGVDPKGTIVLLHGGAYVRRPLTDHWRFADALVNGSGWKVILPIYPKAPHATVETAMSWVDNIMDDVLDQPGPVVLMGDSAGGGLALALVIQRLQQMKTLPQQLILLSPWLDIALRNPALAAFEQRDPILAREGLRTIGQQWSGTVSLDDPRVTPLKGLMKGLPPLIISVGTEEIFYPDVIELSHRAKALGIQTELRVGQGLFHCYPIFPIPEAQPEIEAIIQRLPQ